MQTTLLTILAFSLVIVFMILIMNKCMSTLTALILIPIIFALLGGFGAEIGPMMLNGVKAIAPTAAMLMFAILYFGIMTDAGLFDPMIKWIVRIVQGNPVRIVVGTAVLALAISLDGDGSTTYLITTAAMLPLYIRLGMSRIVLASVIMQAGGVMNILPWGGPTARAAAALHVNPSELFVPLIPAMVIGAGWVIFVAWLFGRNEQRRLGRLKLQSVGELYTVDKTKNDVVCDLQRPRMRCVNLLLTSVLIICLVIEVLPLPILFMIACALALCINYPSLQMQSERLHAHAGNILAVISVIFGAGIFTGILSGTKMIEAMATAVIACIPEIMGPHLAIITGVLSLPFTFFISNDAFYYGVVPVLSQTASAYGISAVEIGRAALIGQPVHLLSPLVPSTYLLVGLVGIELSDHQRFTLKWTIVTSFILLAVALVTRAIPVTASYS